MKRLMMGLVLAAATAMVWLPASDALAVCCGADCCCAGDGIQAPGDTNPANSCEVCDPSVSQFEWTPVEGCTTGDPDMGTGGGGDGGDGGCSAAGGPAGAYGFALVGAALAFLGRRRRR